jgi:hypothetical protein
MKRFSLPPAIVLCGVLLLVHASFSAQKSSSRSATSIVVFAVWPAQRGKTPDTPLLDPIVLLNGASGFQKPPEYNDAKQKVSDAEYARFDQTFYGRGRRYPLLIHGGVAGEVTVVEPTSISCIDHMAKVKLMHPLPEDHIRIAATSIERLGVHPDRDRTVTPEDRGAFLEAAGAALRRKGVPSPVASRIKIDHLYSVSLSPDQPNALVGSVTARSKSAIHHLFLLATKAD